MSIIRRLKLFGIVHCDTYLPAEHLSQHGHTMQGKWLRYKIKKWRSTESKCLSDHFMG